MVVLVSLQMVELTHTDLNIITRSVYFILYILEVYLTICPSLAYSDFLSPVRLLPLSLLSLLPCVSLLLIILSLSAHGVLALHPLPHSLSLSLSLGQQMETMAQFCLLFWVPRETCGFLDSTQLSSPYLIQNASAFLFTEKREAVECMNLCIEMSITSGYYNLRLFITYRLHWNVLFRPKSLSFSYCLRVLNRLLRVRSE